MGYLAFIFWLWSEKDEGGMRNFRNTTSFFSSWRAFSCWQLELSSYLSFERDEAIKLARTGPLEVILFSRQHCLPSKWGVKWAFELIRYLTSVTRLGCILAGFYEGWHFKFGNATCCSLVTFVSVIFIFKRILAKTFPEEIKGNLILMPTLLGGILCLSLRISRIFSWVPLICCRVLRKWHTSLAC